MKKIEQLKAILDKYLPHGKYSYVDDGEESVKLVFTGAEVKGEVWISNVNILNLFLAVLGGIENLQEKSADDLSCDMSFFLDLVNLIIKKSSKKKKIMVSEKDINGLILISSFLKKLIEQQDGGML
jgi:hypothetical protein